ncbi:hypothetical protein DS742_23735 [Lacrimispora amygdalina]|uniref:Guanylate kinase n=1 Tax=Lacrimispora amygdalina TaxID=253257 RepID=A0A3E2N5Y5_9FIRM|nr:guanylate kinase [Clostridium indicum]RFZ76408.1 hypothetical protein DS742_23735 [Clostridium indicum]
MTIVLVGASGSGKSTIEDYFVSNLGYAKIVSYTTRQPRAGEINGKDYWFVSNQEFGELISKGELAEYEEYSQGRFYGTSKSEYTSGNKIVVLTPNGFRQLKRNLKLSQDILTVYVDASLGNRMVRYIKRCGVDKFTYDDKNEICSRVERDFGMFLGIKDEVDFVVDSNESVLNAVNSIIGEVRKREIIKEDLSWS